ncbi:hypothetical protein PI86_03990 [Burkholderia sp. A9]|uniref:hypothetical protein n=1 Tax=Burkholderia sp. A9 TaxID=1365108 RepID=UPI0005744BEA|nr:hypothetical protein [Burkholderia sp. A9]KHK60178.1 hypothetical protein PI86_03990 [Burkholderia sp. A9]
MEKPKFEGEDFKVVPLTPDVLVELSKDLRKRPELFRKSLGTVPVIERNGRPFAVRLADIPEPHRTAFDRALTGSAVSVLDGEGDFAYAWDFADWVSGTRRWL